MVMTHERWKGEDLGREVDAWAPAMMLRLDRRAQQGIGELDSIYRLKFSKFMWPNI
jgi:hypothetical protein